MTDNPPAPAGQPPAGSRTQPRQEHPGAAGDSLIRWGATLSVLLVTGIAAVISYGHAYELVRRLGEIGDTARVLPLTVDGLVGTCSLVLLHSARRHQRPPWHAWGLLVIGICATAAANVAHGISHGIAGAIVAGWPALVAVGSFELLIRLIRDSGPARGDQHGRGQRDTAAPATPEETIAGPTGPLPMTDPAVLAARERYAVQLTAGDLPSVRAIKRDLHLGHIRASRVRASLNGHPTPERSTE